VEGHCRSSLPDARADAPQPTPPARAERRDAAAAIADPALRERFLESAARYLDRFPAR
jgi:uncharacterized membrane protein